MSGGKKYIRERVVNLQKRVRDMEAFSKKRVRDMEAFSKKLVRDMVVYGKKCVQEGEGYQKSCRPPPSEDIFWNSPKATYISGHFVHSPAYGYPLSLANTEFSATVTSAIFRAKMISG